MALSLAFPATAKPALDLNCEPCRFALTPESRSSAEIEKLKQQIPTAPRPLDLLERLGWKQIERARLDHDPGAYKLAETTARCLLFSQTTNRSGKLLLGHALQSMHRFQEAEVIGRELVKSDGRSFDFALLGDALMEQGKLSEAITAYQEMIDLKPDMQGYARIANIRWLVGDPMGALEVMGLAASAVDRRTPEPFSWAQTRLGFYRWTTGEAGAARLALGEAMSGVTNYPPAHYWLGRMDLAEGKNAEALAHLKAAAGQQPLPETLWALQETWSQLGREKEAAQVEGRLLKTGATEDARGFSIYLSTRGLQTNQALQLARKELNQRRDIHTYDALAWALLASGDARQAYTNLLHAVSENTRDARLYFHAAAICAAAEKPVQAREWTDKALEMRSQLLPSEQRFLDRLAGDTNSSRKLSVQLEKQGSIQ